MINLPLTGRVAIVTGSSRGMGRAMAVAFAANGANVVINYRERQDDADDVAEEVRSLGRQATVVQADVSQSDDVDRLVSICASELGPASILVNNAGIGQRVVDVDELDLELWLETLAVNLTSAFLMTKAVLPAMRSTGWGRIINIASTLRPRPASSGSPTATPPGW
jgi:3-oxoacyl-[acyl-carrier protein] reductase